MPPGALRRVLSPSQAPRNLAPLPAWPDQQDSSLFSGPGFRVQLYGVTLPAGKQTSEVGRGHRTTEQKSLCLLALGIPEKSKLLLRLYALGYH